MKKALLTSILLIGGITLVACGGKSTDKNKDYYIVDYKYNLENNNGTYMSVIVMKDATIKAPKEPEVEDYVFTKWYLDKECTTEYLRWGLQLDSDLTLYAKWVKFEDQTIDVKINKFQEKLANMGKDASRVVQETEAIVGYPGVISGEDGVFGVKDRYIYKRYNGITVKDYYQYKEEDIEPTLYGTEQYYHEGRYLYKIYDDFEDDQQDSTESYPYDDMLEESFVSIDFQNLFKECEDNILFYNNSSDYNEDSFEYAFTGNFTKLNRDLVNYSYQEAYFVAYFASNAGVWVSNQYTYDIGLRFNDGIIISANLSFSWQMFLGDEIYQYAFETSTYDFYYNGGVFENFNGEYLPHN